MVRIIKTELEYFKNVQYGEIKYMTMAVLKRMHPLRKMILWVFMGKMVLAKQQ